MSPRKNDARAAGRGRSSARGPQPERAPRDIEKAFGFQRIESARDGDWVVRLVTGASTAKTYRCPGCDQEIRPGVPHVVAWPADTEEAAWHGGSGLDDRRHWHTPCWNARLRRR